MDFDAWTNRASDPKRTRRLAFGYAIGLVTLLGFGTALALTSHQEEAEEEEEDVQNVLLASEPEPEPEPEAPEPANVAPAPAQPRAAILPNLAVPTEIPSDAPSEATPTSDFNPYASGDPYQYATRGRVANRAPAVVKAASPALASVPLAGAVRVTADTTPPQKLSGASFSYPAAAKAAGIEGRVIVKFVVTEGGTVTDIQVVKGPDGLRDAVIEMVKTYKYSPAMRGGKAVSVIQTKVFTFKLTTQ